MRRVEVWYDFACPFAYVAHERVHKAWRRLPLDFVWVPWERWPGTPPTGSPSPPADAGLGPLLERHLAEENLPFRRAKVWPNSNLALRAALWAEGQDQRCAEDFRDRVFRRLYERGLDIHHIDVLAGLVESVGLDPILFLDDLKAGAFVVELRANSKRADALGVRQAATFLLGARLLPGEASFEEQDATLRACAGLP